MTATCPQCHAGDFLLVTNEITRKRRVKFGFMWLTATVLTGGVALVAYIVWPRRKEVVGVDRHWRCQSCKAVSPA